MTTFPFPEWMLKTPEDPAGFRSLEDRYMDREPGAVTAHIGPAVVVGQPKQVARPAPSHALSVQNRIAALRDARDAITREMAELERMLP